MAAKISAVSVRITASLTGFSAGLKRASAQLGTFQKSTAIVGRAAGAMAGRFAALGGMIAGAFSIASIVAFTRQSMTAMDATAKLSDQLGIATEKLGGLQHAGNLAGVPSKQLAISLRMMQKTVSNAANGSKTLQDTIAALGLDIESLKNQTPDEQLRRFADGFAKVANVSDRTRMAMEIFGRSGSKMISMLKDGSAGLDAMQADAEKLGIAFSRVDGAKIEAANDAIARLKSAFTGLSNTLAIELSPFIKAAADSMTTWLTDSVNGTSKVSAAFQELLHWVGQIGDFINNVREGFYFLGGGAAGVIADMLHGFNTMKNAGHTAFIYMNKIAIDAFASIVSAARKSLDFIITSFNKLSGVVGIEFEAIGQTGIEKSLDKMSGQMLKKIKEVNSDLISRPEISKDLDGVSKDWKKKAQDMAEAQPFSSKVQQWYAQIKHSTDGQLENQQGITDELGEQFQEAKKIKDLEAGFMMTKAGTSNLAGVASKPMDGINAAMNTPVMPGVSGLEDDETTDLLEEANGYLSQMAARPPAAAFA